MSASLDVVFPGFTGNDKYRESVISKISRATGEFNSALNMLNRPVLLRELMFFNLMKTKVTLHQKYLARDYAYWQETGWLHKDFYKEENIPAIKNIFAKALVKLKVKKLKKSSGMESMFQ